LAGEQKKSMVFVMGKLTIDAKTTFDNSSEIIFRFIFSFPLKKPPKTNGSRVQVQMTSTIHFIRKVIEYADLPQQKITENLLRIMRPAADFQHQSWCEAIGPYVFYLYSAHQTKTNQNQFYENFSFRSDNFSLTRFNKQLKHILLVIVDNTIDTMKNVEKILAEEPELKDNESEWSSQINSTFDKEGQT
jgi:hypothetical protein